MIPVIVLRPERGSASTVQLAARSGLEVQAFPLSQIEAVAWEPPAPDGIGGLLLGSANAVRHAGPSLALYRDKPAFVVGPATAAAARKAGLPVQLVGAGGLQQVLDTMPDGQLTLLRLAARNHVDVVLPEGISVGTRVVYAAQDLPMPPALAALLRAPALVLLHSAAVAQHFAGECDRLGIDRSHIKLAALGPRILDAAGSGWAAVHHPQKPLEADLLALARDLCQ